MKKVLILFCSIFISISTFAQTQTKGENLKIDWPDEYNWKIGSNQEDESQHMIELVPGNESVEKWTIIGTMISMKGIKNVPMDVAMNIMFEQAKKNAIKPTLTPVTRNDTARNPWIIFKIEAPKFKNDKNPESQLFYVIQGNTALYTNFIAIKEKTLSKEFVDKWTNVFKKSELVNE